MESVYLCRPLPESLAGLATLALDLRWTWCHAADELWHTLDPEVWTRTHNPWLVLQNTSGTRLEALAGDRSFLAELQRLLAAREVYLARPGWYGEHHGGQALRCVAYFSMEFGIGDALPLYAGGLGVLAGDFLKGASDLGVPLVGLGLLYHEGYFRQVVGADGRQQEVYPFNDLQGLPVQPVRSPGGGWLRVTLDLPGRELLVRVWRAQLGRVPLFLLDSNDPLNSPADRGITGRLYESGEEVRLLQELVLGVAGWRALKGLGYQVDVCHLNEGHAAFVVLERARDYMQAHGVTPHQALWATRAGNVFTTHTPVAAGFDTFDPALVARYFRDYAESVGATLDELLALGMGISPEPGARFSMAHLAMRGCTMANGVSRLHGEVSRRLFASLYPGWPLAEVPVTHVTNGVHLPSWDSPWADALWTGVCGKGRWLAMPHSLEDSVGQLSDERLWAFRGRGRQDLVHYARQRLHWQLALRGAPREQIDGAHHVLDPNVLTVGFARRFTEYKRTNLLLQDPERLARLLTDRERPVQLVVAGKAHPADGRGKEMLRAWLEFVQRPGLRNHVVFLADYDISLAQELAHGVDLWINNPRRPWEACGTSGMKVLVNGGLNLSVPDGWWDEAYEPGVGWAIGPAGEDSGPGDDAADAQRLYELLESEIIPEFYRRDAQGIPRGWVARIRGSMGRLVARFSANRMLREYVEQIYLPVAARYARRVDPAMAVEMDAWGASLRVHWPTVHFGNVEIEHQDGGWSCRVQVYLGELDTGQARVELYADGAGGQAPRVQVMERADALPGALNAYVYACHMPAECAAADFTPRVVPWHPLAAVPAEAREITWQR